MRTPAITSWVHYVSYGTPGGEYPPVCRAAVITEVGQWVTLPGEVNPGTNAAGQRVREVTQVWQEDACAVFVINPTGVFFNGAGPVPCPHDEDQRGGGTWHWADTCPGAAPRH